MSQIPATSSRRIGLGIVSTFGVFLLAAVAYGVLMNPTVTHADSEFDEGPITIQVIKHVINDNGGTKSAQDFTITVTSSDRAPMVFPGSEAGTTNQIYSGSFAVTEGAHDGYTMTVSGDCDGIAEQGGLVCTITNDDIAAPPAVLGESVVPTVLPSVGTKYDVLAVFLASLGAFASYLWLRRTSNQNS